MVTPHDSIGKRGLCIRERIISSADTFGSFGEVEVMLRTLGLCLGLGEGVIRYSFERELGFVEFWREIQYFLSLERSIWL